VVEVPAPPICSISFTLGVAQPAPVMKAYILAECETVIRQSDECHHPRPWYVLGPGHRWPSFCSGYKVMELLPQTCGATRLDWLRWNRCASPAARRRKPSQGVRIVEVQGIRVRRVSGGIGSLSAGRGFPHTKVTA
jgi:hypothetical protein